MKSAYEAAKAVANEINAFVSGIDIDALPLAQNKLLNDIKRTSTDVRLDCRDYEYAETRNEQLLAAGVAKKRLEYLEKLIVTSSEQGTFSSVDVAHYSARIQEIIAGLV